MATTPREITVSVKGADKLQKVFDLQSQFQDHTPGGVTSYLNADPEATMRMIREQALAMQAELFEAINECGWKPWASSRHFNIEAFRSELIDTLRFLINLMLIADMDADDVYRLYVKSMQKTIARLGLATGYDGVTGKCPGCKRAYDDTAVRCIASPGDQMGSAEDQAMMKGISYCQVRGYINGSGEPMTTTPAGDWVLADAA